MPLWDNKGLPIRRRPCPNFSVPLARGQQLYSSSVGFPSSKVHASKRRPPEIWKSDSHAAWIWSEELQILSVWFALSETNQITVPCQTESLPNDAQAYPRKAIWLYFPTFFDALKRKLAERTVLFAKVHLYSTCRCKVWLKQSDFILQFLKADFHFFRHQWVGLDKNTGAQLVA